MTPLLTCPHTPGTLGDPTGWVFAQPEAQSLACAGPGSRRTGRTRRAGGAGLWSAVWEPVLRDGARLAAPSTQPGHGDASQALLGRGATAEPYLLLA